jgi:superfamily II DNA or RNA helicase
MFQLRPHQQLGLNAMKNCNKGVLVMPTGAGKSLVMMEDAKQRIQNSSSPITFVIVAPKILLATQLASQFKSYLSEFNIYISHIHSGEDGCTDIEHIKITNQLVKNLGKHHLFFTTYQSLSRLNEINLHIDYCYFDEAHHSTKESNFVGVAQTSHSSKNTFFFTATPKHTDTSSSMDNSDVYGGNICTIPAKELVEGGYILPPEIVTYEFEATRNKDNSAFVDADSVIKFINSIDIQNPKILVASPSTQVIMDMFTETELLVELAKRNYTVMHITSKYGPVINGETVSREKFFNTLSRLGNDDNERFIVFHYSILSEGIDCPGLSHALLLRNLPYIELVQTIGRILRMNRQDYQDIQNGLIKPGDFKSYRKPSGIIAVPVENNYGTAIAKRLQNVVNHIFVEGDTLVV